MSDPNLSAFTWSVADLLRGDSKQSEYGKIILPFTVLRRLDCVLESTKDRILAERTKVKKGVDPDPFLLRASGQRFYNTGISTYVWIVSNKKPAALNRIVVMFLDYAEDQARRKQAIHIDDWKRKLDEFLRFNERAVLPDAGGVSREEADRKAIEQYEEFAATRRALRESAGEVDALRALEDVARAASGRRRKRGREKRRELPAVPEVQAETARGRPRPFRAAR